MDWSVHSLTRGTKSPHATCRLARIWPYLGGTPPLHRLKHYNSTTGLAVLHRGNPNPPLLEPNKTLPKPQPNCRFSQKRIVEMVPPLQEAGRTFYHMTAFQYLLFGQNPMHKTMKSYSWPLLFQYLLHALLYL